MEKRDVAIDREVKALRDRFLDTKERLIKTHASWKAATDVRITLFYKCVEVLDSIQLCRMHLAGNLTSKKWWKTKVNHTNPATGVEEEIPDSIIQTYVNKYDGFIRLGFLHFLFSSIESSFRAIVRALPHGFSGTESFWKVYKTVLTEADMSPDIPLLRLFSELRNTIHNNGIYFPNHGGMTTPIPYRGDQYEFRVGQPITFWTWEFALAFAEDLRATVERLVSHAGIAAYPHILDPAAK